MGTQLALIRKRGPKSNKIAAAFRSVPSFPVFAEPFAASHGISISVLRQAKRFDPVPAGRVRVRQIKAPVLGGGFAKTLMIWREEIERRQVGLVSLV